MSSATLRGAIRFLAEAAAVSMEAGMQAGSPIELLVSHQAQTFREIEHLAVAAGVPLPEVRGIISATLLGIANKAGRILLEEDASPAVMDGFDRACTELHEALLSRMRKAQS